MIRNFIQNKWRNLKRDKLSSFINIIGLATGLTTFILVGIYVQNELSYDMFHKNYNRIYEISINGTFNSCAPAAEWIKDKYPEIEDIVRLDKYFGGGESTVLKYDGESLQKSIDVDDIIYAGTPFFDMFDFKILLGDPKTALQYPYSIVLSESVAERLFGKENPIGKNINFYSKKRGFSLDLTITAVIEDSPKNSSILYNAIISFATRYSESPQIDEDWSNWGYPTYIKVNKDVSIDDFTAKVNPDWLKLANKKLNISAGSDREKEILLDFVPLKEVHFYKNNKLQLVYFFLSIGILVLLLAIINFINLSIAGSSTRFREVGIKKVFGSGRIKIMYQFLSESVILSLLATLLALLIIIFLSPGFLIITGWKLSLVQSGYFYMVPVFLSGIIILGIIVGIYPALYLSSFEPVKLLKNEISNGNRSKSFQRQLIVFQFIISTTLIIFTIVVLKQVRYLKTTDIGFNKENIVYFNYSDNLRKNYDAFKQRLLLNPSIIKISSSNTPLAQEFPMTNNPVIDGKQRLLYTLTVDPDFVQTMGIKLIRGRDFSWEIKSDQYGAMIINETAVKKFDLAEPVGTKLELFGHHVYIIGVMKDFHAGSFYQKIPPSALWVAPWNGTINVRLDSKNTHQSIAYIKKAWEEFSPGIPFEYHFLNERYDSLYKFEEKLSILIVYFSVLAILIACLGLFGLVSFSTVKRLKEIGIRKVNGARISEIIILLNKSFVLVIMTAFIIACPVAFYLVRKWLQNYAYKTDISWWIFPLAAFIVLIVVSVTVSWHSWRAAYSNPVKALRNE